MLFRLDKNRVQLNKFLCAILSVLCIGLNQFVKAKESKKMPNDICLTNLPCNAGNYGTLEDYLNFKQSDVHFILDTYWGKKTESKFGFEVDEYTSLSKQGRSSGFYFTDKKKVVGYLLTHRKSLSYDLSYLQNYPLQEEITQHKKSVQEALGYIKSLHNKKYRLPLSGQQINLYTSKMDTHKYIVGTITTKNAIYVVLEGYLPQRTAKKYQEKALKKVDKYISKGFWEVP